MNYKKIKDKAKEIANRPVTIKDVAIAAGVLLLPGSIVGVSAYLIIKNYFKKKEEIK